MLNKVGIKKETAVSPVQILFDVQNRKAVSIMADKSMAGVVENGRKILKAGTPMAGDLSNRTVAFKAPVDDTNPAVGILLHDVDITEVNANATLLIWGFVNLDRVDATTAALITATRKTELNGKVWFLKDN